MATNSLEICNSALTLVGSRKIVSLSDPSVEARECNANYDISRKAVLRDHPWNFATKRAILTVVNITNAVSSSGLIKITATAHGFSTNNMVNISGMFGTIEANGIWTITVVDANNFTLTGSTFTNTYTSGGVVALAATFEYANQFIVPTDFIRVHTVMDSSGVPLEAGRWRFESSYVLTDEATIWLKYVMNLTTTTQFDPLFDEALSAHLAEKICFKITGSETQRQTLFQLYKDKLQRAKFTSGVEEPSEKLDSDEWLRARYGRASDFVRDPGTN